MIKILFVCHGNICRSPMAEYYMRDLAARAGLAGLVETASAATSTEELGNGIYPPARRLLEKHGIACADKRVRLLRPDDGEDFDLLIGMDAYNLRNMRRVLGSEAEDKLHLLLDYTDRPGQSVADPWYTRDFEATWADVSAGCAGLLEQLAGAPLLDLSACRSRREIYAVLRRVMAWESWYGENLDAVYDVLTGLPHEGKRFALALPFSDSPVHDYALRLREVFRDAGCLLESE